MNAVKPSVNGCLLVFRVRRETCPGPDRGRTGGQRGSFKYLGRSACPESGGSRKNLEEVIHFSYARDGGSLCLCTRAKQERKIHFCVGSVTSEGRGFPSSINVKIDQLTHAKSARESTSDTVTRGWKSWNIHKLIIKSLSPILHSLLACPS